MYLKALEFASVDEQKQLRGLFSLSPENPSEKINAVKHFFETTGAKEATRAEIEKYTQKAFSALESLAISEDNKKLLRFFGENLMNRSV